MGILEILYLIAGIYYLWRISIGLPNWIIHIKKLIKNKKRKS